MARQLAHPLRSALVDSPDTSSSRTGGEDGPGERAPSGSDGDLAMFGEVDPQLRMRMELVARASAGPGTALPHVVSLLVAGDRARDAVVAAINDNETLRAQWLRAWEALRR